MDTGFYDPIAPKSKKPANALEYDNRSSRYQSIGTDYGVGHAQPTGHEGNPAATARTLPTGRVNTLNIYEEK